MPMIVRLPAFLTLVDPRKLAALVTAGLLSPAVDDAPAAGKPGDTWLRWGDAHARAGAHLN
jgi:hypothetical protein